MVPYESKGSSFKGAGLYYLHDRDALTGERVGWTHTGNLATGDPERAIREMIAVYYERHDLQKEAGIAQSGRDVEKPVLAFSLSWHPEQNPTKEEMLKAGYSVLEALKLREHQFILLCHTDTGHAHIHGIVNRIHPETGRTADLSYSKLKLSRWAEQYEKGQGNLYCFERIKNNEKRRNGEYARHNDTVIRQAWEHSDNGRSFASALSYHGYTLAKGDRRDFTVIDKYGKAVNPVRHLPGVKTKAFRERLSDLDRETLQSADNVIHGVRQRREATDEGRKDFTEAAQDKAKEQKEQETKTKEREREEQEKKAEEQKQKKAKAQEALRLKQREEKKALDESAVRRREELRGELAGNNRKEKELAFKNAQTRLKKLESKGFLGHLWNWKTMKALRDDIPELKSELRDIRRHEDGQTGLLERDIRREKQQLERRQSLERAELEKEYVRPANDNSLKKSFEKAEHQQESHEQDTGRTRAMTPPGYGLRR